MADDFLQAASNAVASGVSFPVDALAWALRKGGVPVGKKPIGGSDWMKDVGLTKETGLETGGSLAGETVGNLIQPLAPAVKGAAAAYKAGLMIPILRKGMLPIENASAGRQADLEKAVKLAEELRAKGATPTDIWQTAKVSKVPRFAGEPARDPLAGKWAHEISRRPGEDLFSPYASMSMNDKIDFAAKNYPELLTSNAPEDMKALENLLQNKILLPDNYLGASDLLTSRNPVTDVLQHPAFEEYPELAKIDLRFMTENLDKNPKIARAPGGTYYPGMAVVDVNKGTTLREPGDQFSPEQVLTHELQHHIQTRMGMPGGGSPSFTTTSPEQTDKLYSIAEALNRISDEGAPAQLAENLRAFLPKTPHMRYESLLGERQANAAALRSKFDPATLAEYNPGSMYTGSGMDPAVWTQAVRQLHKKPGAFTDDELARSLIEQLRVNHLAP